MSPLYRGLLWFIPGLVILLGISFIIFDEDGKTDLKSIKSNIWKARGGFLILLIVLGLLQLENFIHDIHPPGFRVTWWFYSLEGVGHVVWLQQTLDNYYLIHASSIFYILGLSYFVIFAPIFFLIRCELDIFEQFCKALAVNYMFLLPGYFLLHVLVTSYYRPGEVQALLYDIPQYEAVVLLTNRQSNCFPSGHISIPLTITLIAKYRTGLRKLQIMGFIFVIITGFVILYLGIHWLIDIPAGIAVAIFAYWSTSNGRSDIVFDKITKPFEKWTESFKNRSVNK
ncbi:MAG: phosphatase PAP2 family protein [Candidatus Saliniplasma sp.]